MYQFVRFRLAVLLHDACNIEGGIISSGEFRVVYAAGQCHRRTGDGKAGFYFRAYRDQLEQAAQLIYYDIIGF